MRAYEFIVLKESYYDELLDTVRDLLLIAKPGADQQDLDAMKFKQMLAAAGYNPSDDDLKDVINSSKFAKLNGNRIQYTDAVPTDLAAQGTAAEAEPEEVVSDLAQAQAMKDIKA